VFLGAKNTGCVLNVSNTLERAHCRSQVLGVDDVVPLEHRARAVPAHAHDDGFRDAHPARPGDEAPPEVVEPEALNPGGSHCALEGLPNVHPAGARPRIDEDELPAEAGGRRGGRSVSAMSRPSSVFVSSGASWIVPASRSTCSQRSARSSSFLMPVTNARRRTGRSASSAPSKRRSKARVSSTVLRTLGFLRSCTAPSGCSVRSAAFTA